MAGSTLLSASPHEPGASAPASGELLCTHPGPIILTRTAGNILNFNLKSCMSSYMLGFQLLFSTADQIREDLFFTGYKKSQKTTLVSRICYFTSTKAKLRDFPLHNCSHLLCILAQLHLTAAQTKTSRSGPFPGT